MPKQASSQATKEAAVKRYLQRVGYAKPAIANLLAESQYRPPLDFPEIEAYRGARDVKAARLPEFVVQLPEAPGDLGGGDAFRGSAGSRPLKISRRIKQPRSDDE